MVIVVIDMDIVSLCRVMQGPAELRGNVTATAAS